MAALPPTHTVVMAKAPVPGFAKTRLQPALGAEGAAALAARLLRHAVAEALQAGLGTVELCVTPDPQHPAFAALHATPGLQWCAQGEGDLGERMARAFSRVFATAGQPTLLIGTDAPDLDARMLRQAAQELEAADAVFVPALDGGYAAQ